MATFVDPRKFKPITARYIGEALDVIGEEAGEGLKPPVEISDVEGLQSALDSKGTSNLTIGTTSTTAKAGDYKPSVADVPNLPASKINSGVLAADRLPDATVSSKGTVKVAGSVADATDETDIVAQFNALLASLRTSGLLAT